MQPHRSIIPFIVLTLGLFFQACEKNAPSGAKNKALTRSDRRKNQEALASFPHPPFKQPRPFVPGAPLRGVAASDPRFELEWNRFRIVNDYQKFGRTNSLWDSAALAALDAYASVLSEKDPDERKRLNDEIAAAVGAAVKAGCNDPLIHYLQTRFAMSREQGMTDAILAQRYQFASDDLESTEYSSFVKTVVSLRAAEAMKAAMAPNLPAPLMVMRIRELCHLREALSDTKMPPDRASNLCQETWDAFEGNVGIRDEFQSLVVPVLDRVWKRESFGYRLKGQMYRINAWDARGRGYANTVTKEGWKEMSKNLELARASLEKAWDIDKRDARIPVEMLWVCLGQQVPRAEMERWFNRAMEIDPACFDAAWNKLEFLQPRWYGTAEDVLAFGQECVASPVWKGRVPLILAYAHEGLSKNLELADRDNYWLNPRVWPDLQKSYERYFELNPGDNSYRHNYALYAFKCAKYPEFLHQLTYFNNWTNFGYFGGKEKFDAMIRKAMENTKSAAKAP